MPSSIDKGSESSKCIYGNSQKYLLTIKTDMKKPLKSNLKVDKRMQQNFGNIAARLPLLISVCANLMVLSSLNMWLHCRSCLSTARVAQVTWTTHLKFRPPE
jgi:hypothetical protein